MIVNLKINPEIEQELNKAKEHIRQASKILFELESKLLVAEKQPTENSELQAVIYIALQMK